MEMPEFTVNKQNLEILIEIADRAGKKILDVYNDEARFSLVDFKTDKSPLTIADKDSHIIISRELQYHFPNIPIISEEGKEIPYSTRKNWNYFWLVDPLDGTREFIKRNGEFTINIALIENNYPVIGLISAPVKQVIYWGGHKYRSYKYEKGKITEIHVSSKKTDLSVVQSRSHSSEQEKEFYSKYPVKEYISVGSALKFCMIAEGTADLYYRHGPTMEWDTAAGQAIVEGARGEVLNAMNKKFAYNKESLINENFLVINHSH
jgi:3'(2'), 5'-bisphosphate nucleotidase